VQGILITAPEQVELTGPQAVEDLLVRAQLATLIDVLHIDAVLVEHLRDELRAMAALRSPLATHDRDSMAILARPKQSFDPLHELWPSPTRQVVDAPVLVVAARVIGSTPKLVAHKDVLQPAVLETRSECVT
jgi:hypothetical protein